MFKRKSDPITRDELNVELKGFDAYQKLNDKQFGEIKQIFNDTVQKINFFIQITNATLSDTQKIEKVTAKVLTELHQTNKSLVERIGALEKRVEMLESKDQNNPMRTYNSGI